MKIEKKKSDMNCTVRQIPIHHLIMSIIHFVHNSYLSSKMVSYFI